MKKYKFGTLVITDLNIEPDEFGIIIGYKKPLYKVLRYHKIYSIHESNILTKKTIKHLTN